MEDGKTSSLRDGATESDRQRFVPDRSPRLIRRLHPRMLRLNKQLSFISIHSSSFLWEIGLTSAGEMSFKGLPKLSLRSDSSPKLTIFDGSRPCDSHQKMNAFDRLLLTIVLRP